MNPGKLNRRITFKQFQEIKNEEGVYVKEWVDFKTVWAFIKPLTGSQVYTQQATENKATVKANMRYFKDVNENMRVQIDDVLYDIDYIEDVDYKHIELWVTLKKVI